MRSLILTSALTVAFFALAPRVALAAPESVRVYRLYAPSNGDHMSSTYQYEASTKYYAESSILYYAQPYGGNGGTPGSAHPVYRCYIWGWDHMDTTMSNCEIGGTPEGILGYLLDGPAAGHMAVYRCRQRSNSEHFNSTDIGCEGHINEGTLGYALIDGFQSYPKAALNQGTVSSDCMGRCGAGCGWMPWEAWTSQCYEHDVCVQQHGYLALQCDVLFVEAAVSYVVAGVKQLINAVVDFVSSLFSWL